MNIGGWLALNDRSLYEEASNRIGQVEYLGEKLSNWGVPIVHPVGGQAIFLDARAFYPQISQESSRRPNR